jgi:ArsR family transcriptional regulator, arsenate/arsenite/antimonite-responsive transcriptional repressor
MKVATVDRVARQFQALSDPTRLELLVRLRKGERCVCDLMDVLDAAQSRLSFHLKVLKEAGLVTDRRDGRWVYYTLVPETIAEIREYVDDLAPKFRALPMAKGSAGCD